jgi:hypothetical protein
MKTEPTSEQPETAVRCTGVVGDETARALQKEWEEEKVWLDKICDRGPCTGQSCGWIGCAKLADRLFKEAQTARRKKWRESKRRQRERSSPTKKLTDSPGETVD